MRELIGLFYMQLCAMKDIKGFKYVGTLARINIRPFADFSYKMVIFKRLEKYLKLTQKSSFLDHLLMLMGDPSQ